MKKLLIVDDHAVVREGLKSALEGNFFEVVGLAQSVEHARALIAHTNPEVIIVDLNLPDGSGFDLILWMRAISKEIGIIVLTLNDESHFIHAAKKAGANAYILKSDPLSALIAAVHFCAMNPASFTVTSSLSLDAPHVQSLTARETDVILLLSKGQSNKEIGATLFLSQSTIKTHIASIFRKLEAPNRVLAVKIAKDKGLLVE